MKICFGVICLFAVFILVHADCECQEGPVVSLLHVTSGWMAYTYHDIAGKGLGFNYANNRPRNTDYPLRISWKLILHPDGILTFKNMKHPSFCIAQSGSYVHQKNCNQNDQDFQIFPRTTKTGAFQMVFVKSKQCLYNVEDKYIGVSDCQENNHNYEWAIIPPVTKNACKEDQQSLAFFAFNDKRRFKTQGNEPCSCSK